MARGQETGHWSGGDASSGHFAAALLPLIAAAVVYAPVLASLVRQWTSDDNYSHGFVVLPFAIYFAWLKRGRLAAAETRPAITGLVVAAAGLLLLIGGVFGAELFLTRVSLPIVIAGSVAWLWGWRHVRLLAFPIAFLVLMIPLPALVFNQIAFPLQMLASRAGAALLSMAGVPVLREGNVLELPSQTLEVAQACSGVRSLVSLLTVALILGRLRGLGRGASIALALLTVPLAIAANAVRVAGAGLSAQWLGPAAAEGFFHEFSGWVVFMMTIVCLLIAERAFMLSTVTGDLVRRRAGAYR